MKQQLNEVKRLQKIAGILNESQINELDPKVDAARKEYLKQLDATGLAMSKLDDIGGNMNGLFSVDKGAQELHDKFFDTTVPAYNELYKYIKGQTAPKLSEEVKAKQGTKASDLQFVLRDLADIYGQQIADDQITDEFKNYTVGQIKNDWISLKKGTIEETANAVDSIPEIQKYLRDLALNISKVKGIDTNEVKKITELINLIISKLGKGSIAPAIAAATDIVNRRTQSLK